jgi:hypothetical protein
MDLVIIKDALLKKVEEVNNKIQQRQKQTAKNRELEENLKEMELKILQGEQQLKLVEDERQAKLTELDRKELGELTQKINLLKSENNKMIRNQNKINGNMIKAQKELKELNAEIPVHIYPKKELGRDMFGNVFMIFSFDTERIYMVKEDFSEGKVFTGNFEYIKDFLTDYGYQQRAIRSQIDDLRNLGILDQGKSERFTVKLFGKSYFSVFDPQQAKKEEEALKENVKGSGEDETQQVVNKTEKDGDANVEKEEINKEKEPEANNKIEIEKEEPKQEQNQKLNIEEKTDKIQEEEQLPKPKKIEEIEKIKETPKATEVSQMVVPKKVEPVPEKDKWIFEFGWMESEEEKEEFLLKLDKKVSKYTQLESQYESMFEEIYKKGERRVKGGKVLDFLLSKYYNFLVKRSLNKRRTVDFLQDIIFFLEEHYSEYLELMDSFWMQKDRWEEEFYNRVNEMRDIHQIKSIMLFLNKSFQVRYFYTEVNDEDLTTAAEVSFF